MGIRSFDSSGHSELSSIEKEIISRSSYLDLLVGSNLSVILEVLALCPMVHNLELSGEMSDSDFQLVVSRVQMLKCWTYISYCSKVTDLINCDIVKFFPDLVEFHSPVDASLVVQSCRLTNISCLGSPQSIKTVAESESIKSLTLRYHYEPTGTTASDLLSLMNLTSLIELTIQEPIVTDEVVTKLSLKCPALTSLDIGESAISDVGLLSVSKHSKNLKSLSIYSELVTDQGVVAIGEGCPRLTKLRFHGCTGITDDAVSTILRVCKNLEELCDHDRISKSVYNGVFSVCPSMRWLDLYTNDAYFLADSLLPTVALEEISFNGGRVKMLPSYRDYATLYNVSLVLFDEDSIMRSFHRSPGLLTVVLECQYHITDACVSSLVQSCPNLICIKLCECIELTSASIITVLSRCSKLQRLAVCGMMSSPSNSTKLQIASKQLTSLSLKHSSVEWLLSQIADQCQSLRTVDVMFASDLTGDTVVQLLHGCCSLNYLRIQEAMVGPEVLQCIVDLNRRMKLVELIRCPLLDNVDQELLRLAKNIVDSLLIQYEN